MTEEVFSTYADMIQNYRAVTLPTNSVLTVTKSTTTVVDGKSEQHCTCRQFAPGVYPGEFRMLVFLHHDHAVDAAEVLSSCRIQ